MLRFTIRDVLWLTVVVGLGCALFVRYQEIGDLKWEIRQQTFRDKHAKDVLRFAWIKERAFATEIEKFTGKKLTGWGYHPDELGPNGYTFHFDYDAPVDQDQ
jgi:hypothetical protein